jgi:hypothetical protein
MKTGTLARSLLRALALLCVVAAFVVLDWYPTVKDLGRLRRERSDWERKIKDYGAMAGSLEFPSAEENELLAQMDSQVLQALPRVDSDNAWFGLARAELLEGAKGLADSVMLFRQDEALDSGPPGLRGWLLLQEPGIRQVFRAAEPLYGVFPLHLATGWRLASQPLGMALQIPVPELLNLINRISWGVARLEIVHLRLEPAGRIVRAWLVCRGVYQLPGPSARSEEWDSGKDEKELLIDPDSPLLLQRIDPLLAPGVEKRELPPAGSPW